MLALLVAASLVLLTAYFGESASSPLHSVQRGIAEVLSPVEQGASKVLSPVRDVAGWVSATINAKSANARLRKQNANLISQLAQAQHQLLLDRQLSGLSTLDSAAGIRSYSPVAADVIEFDPSLWYEHITVDKGTGDGVGLNDPVVGSGGLVGQVTSVGSNYAVVTELNDPRFGVGAQIEDPAGDAGLLQPAVGNPTSLLLQYLPPHASGIQNGDIVVTSGFVDSRNPRIRSYFPPGIPIGSVSTPNSTIQTSLLNQQQVSVTPYVDLRHLSVVQILTQPYPGGSVRAGLTPPTAGAHG